MNTTDLAESSVEDAHAEETTAERLSIVRPEHPNTGYVFIRDFVPNKFNPNKPKRTERFLHGLVVPGLNIIAGETDQPPQARNRLLLVDKYSHEWFQELMATKDLPDEFVNMGFRMNVRGLLRENMAFVQPMARSLDQARMEWKTHQLNHRSMHLDTLSVIDEITLTRVFYLRVSELYAAEGMYIGRIYPDTMTALAMDVYGFYYKLSGADRMKRHIGKDGTNGMILDRDIQTVFRYEQINDPEIISQMLADETAIKL